MIPGRRSEGSSLKTHLATLEPEIPWGGVQVFGETLWRWEMSEILWGELTSWDLDVLSVYLSHENPLTFHYTGCLIGILIMVYYNHLIPKYNWLV